MTSLASLVYATEVMCLSSFQEIILYRLLLWEFRITTPTVRELVQHLQLSTLISPQVAIALNILHLWTQHTESKGK